MEAHRAKTRQRRGLVHDSRPRRGPLDIGSLERLQETLKRLMLPCAEQRNGICSKSIPRVKRPLPSIRTDAFYAVIQLIAVVINRYLPIIYIDLAVAGINLVPRFMTNLTHNASTENRFPQYLRYLSCG